MHGAYILFYYALCNIFQIAFDASNVKQKSKSITLELKMCDYFSLSWAREWIQNYSTVPPRCPLHPVSSFNLLLIKNKQLMSMSDDELQVISFLQMEDDYLQRLT